MKQIEFYIPKRKNEYNYVGLDVRTGNSKFIFPCQYFKTNINEFSTEAEKKQYFNFCKFEAKKLLDIIAAYKYQLEMGNSNGEHFIFGALNWLIRDYINNGYYKEKHLETKIANGGKINWKKTIKTFNCQFVNSNIVFKNFYRYKQQIEENQIITEIYKSCLFYAVENLGWIYDLYNVEKSKFDIDNKEVRNYMISILKQKLSSNFLDYKKQLFGNLLTILMGVENRISNNMFNATDKEFEYVFERLICNVFGTDNVKEYYPHAEYVLNGNRFKASNLRPDTIMKIANFEENFSKNQKNSSNFDYFVIIDAKFYEYGYDGNKKHLPQSSDVEKQIAYAEYIVNNKINKPIILKKNNKKQNVSSLENDAKQYKVKSVFMLPCSKFKYKETKIENYIDCKGFAVADLSLLDSKEFVEKINCNEVIDNICEMDKRVFVCFVDLKTLVDINYRSKAKEKLNASKDLISKINIM